jgi:hypothetical protein
MIQRLGVGGRIGGVLGGGGAGGGLNVCDDEGQHLSELTHGQDSGGEAGALKAQGTSIGDSPAQPNHERNLTLEQMD